MVPQPPDSSVDGLAETAAPDAPSPRDDLGNRVPRTPDSTQSADPRAAAAPRRFIGRFEILRPLGQGGFGAVYEARDAELGRHVAIKLARPERLAERDPADRASLLDLFRHEAEAAAKLNHPHIVTIHDYGTQDGFPYLVLELLTGETLSRDLSRGPLAPTDAVEILTQVCRGLAHAHAAGVIHRDLKPGNVFIREDGQVKILDFGLARVVGALAGGTGREGPTGGTPAYMAPEQWRGEAGDQRTDVFACGVMLFEMLCGRLPFAASERGRSDRDEGRRSLRSRMVGLPPDLVAVTERTLAPDPQDRYASAQELLEALLRLAPPGDGVAAADQPYRYLEQFTEADAAWFFGREREVLRLEQMLAARPFVALVGPSGAGKSSLVHAGLVPHLRRDGKWIVVGMRPGGEPLRRLHRHLVDVCGEGRVAGLVSDPDGLLEAPGRAGHLLRLHARETAVRILLFVDQLEELVTQGASVRVRRAFAEALLSVADEPGGPIRVVVALRDDFLVRVSKNAELREALVRNMVLLGPPDAEGLAEALRGPAARLGYEYEPGLIDEMVAALAEEAAPLPLLQLAASRLWERRDTARRLLTPAGLAAVGGVAGILASHADEVLRRLAGREELGIARRILCDLVTDDGTRRRTRREDVGARFEDPKVAGRVLERLVSGRLVTSSRGEQGEWVDLAHESLIAGWTQLRAWLDEDRADRPFRERLLATATLWQERRQPKELLWRGDTLDEALRWRRRYPGSLSPPEQAFLSRAEARAHRARRVRRRLLVGGAAVALVLILGLVLTVRAYRAAVREARLREIMRTAEGADDPLLGALILAEFEGQPEPPGGAAAAVQVAARPIPLAVYRGHEGASIRRGAFSRDGRWVVTGASDGQVHVWRADGTGSPIVLKGHRGAINGVEFSPDGERVLSASEDQTARIWVADGTGEPIVLPHAPMAHFTPGGAHVAAGGWQDGDVFLRIWRVDGRGEPAVFRHQGRIKNWDVSPDGSRVVAVSTGGVGLWRADGTPIVFRDAEVSAARFTPDGSRIVAHSREARGPLRVWRSDLTAPFDLPLGGFHISFSPDGQRVASVSQTETAVSIVSVDGTGSPVELGGHGQWLAYPVFNPDGSRLLTGGNVTRIWSADGKGEPIVLEGHAGWVDRAIFSPDGTRILTVSYDGTARVWAVGDPSGVRLLPGGSEHLVSVSPDGKLLLTRPHDGAARLRPLSGGAPVLLGREGDAPAIWATFSPDGSRVATAHRDGFRVWPVAGGEPLAIPAAGPVETVAFSPDGAWVAGGAVRSPEVIVARSDGSGHAMTLHGGGGYVSFSPDGTRLVAGGREERVLVWRTDDWAAEPVALQDSAPTLFVPLFHQPTFHPGGSMILIGSDTNTLRLFSRDGREVVGLRRPGGPAVAWSPDGERIATGLFDGSARISRLDLSGETLALRHPGPVTGVAFTPDGRRVATVSTDDAVRLWLIHWDDLVRALRAATHACLTVDQRTTHLDESPDKARAAWEACERRFGRTP